MNCVYSKILIIMLALAFTLPINGQTVSGQRSKNKKQGIDWQISLDAAIREAKRTGKPIMIDFWATWCAPCRAMNKQTYTNPNFLTQAKNFVMAKIDIEKLPEDAQRYQVETPPTVVFLRGDGSIISSFVGFRDSPEIVRIMKSALQQNKQK